MAHRHEKIKSDEREHKNGGLTQVVKRTSPEKNKLLLGYATRCCRSPSDRASSTVTGAIGRPVRTPLK